MNATKKEKQYLAIDLKSFYASAECMRLGLDPLDTNLVVADPSRTEKTICLAVSPSLKQYGIPGRARLFEVIGKVRSVNADRKRKAPGNAFSGSSFSDNSLKNDPSLELDYIVAPPRMSAYIELSTKIYSIYLKYVSREDIHVYSIDEVFIDVTNYLSYAGMSARDFARKIIDDVLSTTGITATAGIGTNLYLSKIAMDIKAKHMPADKDGVRIAELDEMSYRKELWDHRPITDFWRVGKGYADRLKRNNMYTMGDVAMCSVIDEDKLYRLFGINAELLIDHAWGWEPCSISDIKAYKPQSHSISNGQVLKRPYDNASARIIVREMCAMLVLELVDKKYMTDQITLTVEYDAENLKSTAGNAYSGSISEDRYGRTVPKPAHGTAVLEGYTSSTGLITDAFIGLYDKITDKSLTVRKIYVTACRLRHEDDVKNDIPACEQIDIFTDCLTAEQKRAERLNAEKKEKKLQKTIIRLRKKYGKNAVLKGVSLCDGATAIERNGQIGGHKA